MVMCAASGCNNRHKKDGLISFFRFPSNPQTRKAWTHYCKRWGFLPSTSHRFCSAHFTNACYDRDPEVMKNLEGCPTMKPKLLPNAIPDIPFTQQTTAEPRPPILKRGAYEKRRKAEILQLAYDNYERDTECVELQVPDSTTEPEPKLPTSNTSKVTMVTQTTPPTSPKSVKHKKSQSHLRPQQRTRKHQTDLKITQPSATYSTIATQTDDDITKCTCTSIVTTTTNINSAQNSDDDEVSSHADSDEDYQPSDDDQRYVQL
ncbi:uncharacterized protein LOC127735492 [Mytilus californianus]|uniref:uncharacterized protein LOC127735492 n=1 Tax=Mytilus californianus TaxID=6549 RepID=UPI002247A3A9|nr:uncharacterized protein LOC127735492 [Mytilus californianus]